MRVDVHQIKDRVAEKAELMRPPERRDFGKTIVGQQEMISRLLVGLLTDGHILLEGVPGLGKTLTVRGTLWRMRCTWIFGEFNSRRT